jgi:preprotein translocase subunit SecA
MDHIDAKDDLRQGVGLRPTLSRTGDRVQAEGYEMFEAMIRQSGRRRWRGLYTLRLRAKRAQAGRSGQGHRVSHGGDDTLKKKPVKAAKKPGRNDPCPCGSGKEI